MSIKRNLLTAVAVLLALSCCSAAKKDLTPEKLNKNYAKINKYLEKNIPTEDPLCNLAAAIKLQQAKSSKCFSIGGKSLVDTIDLLQQFAGMSSEGNLCETYKKDDMMALVDSGLADESRLKTSNYRLSRIDKIVQHYGFEYVNRCGLTYGIPKLEYGYRQIAYDNINSLLEKALPEVEDVAANMAKAEELLNDMADGALADALRQLLQLKLLLSEDSCGEKGYEITLKNDLATRFEDAKRHGKLTRRVNKIVLHYATKHAQMCRPVVRDLLKPALKGLDRNTYRIVLGLATAYFLKNDKYERLVKELNEKQVDENFSTPLLVELAAKSIYEIKIRANFQPINSWIDPKILYNYITSAYAEASGPLSKYIHGAIVKNRGSINPYYARDKVFEEDKLEKLLEKVLFKPCGRFLNAVEQLLKADNYVSKHHIDSSSDEFIREISYHTARAGYLACKYLADNRENVIQAIMDTSDNHEIPESLDPSTLYHSESFAWPSNLT